MQNLQGNERCLECKRFGVDDDVALVKHYQEDVPQVTGARQRRDHLASSKGLTQVRRHTVERPPLSAVHGRDPLQDQRELPTRGGGMLASHTAHQRVGLRCKNKDN